MHVLDHEENDDISNILFVKPEKPQKSFLGDVDFYQRQTGFRPKTLERIRPIAARANHTVLVRYDQLTNNNIKEEAKLEYNPTSNELYARGYRAIGDLGK
jgi:hypothetical protein